MKHQIKQLVVDHLHEWGRWPDCDNADYADAMNWRGKSVYQHGDLEIEVESRYYPVYKAFAEVDRDLPIAFPWIDNTKEPSLAVQDQMLADLRKLAAECDVVLWNHAKNCYPRVAKHLPELFGLAILPFADDCPGSSEIKTFPVAMYFDAFYYQMYIWDFETGVKTHDKYAAVAPNLKPYFKCQNESTGLLDGLGNIWFNVNEKIALIRQGRMPPIDLVFVGNGAAWHWRQKFIDELNAADFGDLHSALYGAKMRDGVLGAGPGAACGYLVGKLYTQALCGVNPQVSSIFNGRLIDLWACGVIQFIYDPHEELRLQGFEEGTHYLGFDGTAADLIARVEDVKKDPGRCADIIQAAHETMVKYQTERSTNAVYAQIYADWLAGENGRR